MSYVSWQELLQLMTFLVALATYFRTKNNRPLDKWRLFFTKL